MQGETSLFPLTHNPDLFAGRGEVGELARKLPGDGRGSAKPDVRRILGSLPVDDLSQLPLPGVRRDLDLVRAAWVRGESEFVESWSLFQRVAAIALVFAVAMFWAGYRRWRRLRAGRSPSST